MAITGKGFDGTMNEAQFAKLMQLAGARYAVGSKADFAATQVAGARSISIAAGDAYAPGVLVTSTAAEVVAFAAPTAGQWHLIVLRRTWSTNLCELVAVAGAATTSTVPTARPSTLPAINSTPGVVDDQPLWWAWVNAATTTVTLFIADQTDTGDVLAPNASGFTSSAYFRTKDGITTNFGSISPSGNISITSTFVTIATLPPDSDPGRTLPASVTHNLNAIFQIQIASGAIQIRSNSGTVAATTNTTFSLAGNAWRA